MRICAYRVMPNHRYFLLLPRCDGELATSAGMADGNRGRMGAGSGGSSHGSPAYSGPTSGCGSGLRIPRASMASPTLPILDLSRFLDGVARVANAGPVPFSSPCPVFFALLDLSRFLRLKVSHHTFSAQLTAQQLLLVNRHKDRYTQSLRLTKDNSPEGGSWRAAEVGSRMLWRPNVARPFAGIMRVVGSSGPNALALRQEERKPQTPKQQYQTLLEEYERATSAWKQCGKGLKLADPAWREHHAAWPKWSLGPRFLQFAEANPKEPEAVDALLQIVRFLESGHNEDRVIFPVITRAFSVLSAHHLQDERVAQECLRRGRFMLPTMVPYFQALMAKSQDREVRHTRAGG